MTVHSPNTPYQISTTTESLGQTLPYTKRYVRWCFGFANTQNKGHNEHEVTLTWSIASNKRLITFDGNNLHYSIGKQNQLKFEFHHLVEQNHVLHLIAYRVPSRKAKQYELLFDGRRFQSLPLAMELGVTVSNKHLNTLSLSKSGQLKSLITNHSRRTSRGIITKYTYPYNTSYKKTKSGSNYQGPPHYDIRSRPVPQVVTSTPPREKHSTSSYLPNTRPYIHKDVLKLTQPPFDCLSDPIKVPLLTDSQIQSSNTSDTDTLTPSTSPMNLEKLDPNQAPSFEVIHRSIMVSSYDALHDGVRNDQGKGIRYPIVSI